MPPEGKTHEGPHPRFDRLAGARAGAGPPARVGPHVRGRPYRRPRAAHGPSTPPFSLPRSISRNRSTTWRSKPAGRPSSSISTRPASTFEEPRPWGSRSTRASSRPSRRRSALARPETFEERLAPKNVGPALGRVHLLKGRHQNAQPRVREEEFPMDGNEAPEHGVPQRPPFPRRMVAHSSETMAAADVRLAGHQAAVGELAQAVGEIPFLNRKLS